MGLRHKDHLPWLQTVPVSWHSPKSFTRAFHQEMLQEDRCCLVKAGRERKGRGGEGRGGEGREEKRREVKGKRTMLKTSFFTDMSIGLSPGSFLRRRLHHQSSQASEVGPKNKICCVGVQKSLRPDTFVRTKSCPYIMAGDCSGFSPQKKSKSHKGRNETVLRTLIYLERLQEGR